MNDKSGGANDRLDRQNLGARHFAVGGYPGTEPIMMNISIISIINAKSSIVGNLLFVNFLDLQKASGIRVLRHTVDRQKSVQNTEALLMSRLQQHNYDLISDSSSSKSSIDFDKHSVGSGYGSQFMLDTDFSKKPPARLKPLVHHGRRNSVIKGINHPAKEVPTAVMSGSSLTQCVAFSNEHGASLEDKSM